MRKRQGIAYLLISTVFLCATSSILEAGEAFRRVNVTTHKDVEGSGVDLDCTAWIPEGEGPYPVLVLVHGGGFSEGTPMKWLAWQELAAKGYVIFTTRYRLTGEGGNLHTFVQDNLASIKFLAAHAKEYKADMDRIAIIGSSAGGGIVVWMAILGMNGDFQPSWSPYADEDIEIKACVDYYGAWMGHDGEEAVRNQLKDHSDKISTRFFLTHGTADDLVTPNVSLSLYELLSGEDLPEDYFSQARHVSSDAFVPVEAHTYEGFVHAFAYAYSADENQRAMKDLLPFLDRCFSGSGNRENTNPPLKHRK